MKTGFFYGYVITAAAFAVWLIGFGTYTPIFGVFLKPLTEEFGWTRAETSLGYSLSLLLYGFFSIFAGWLTDRLGPRIVVTVLGSFLGIGYLLLSQINVLWQFQLCYALLGAIGTSAIIAPVMASIARWFVRKRGMMMGIAQAGAGIGGLVFAPLAGWLILNYNWRSAYIIIGVLNLALIIGSGLFFRRSPGDAGQLPDGANEVMTEQAKQNRNIPAIELSLRDAIHTSQFWIIFGIYFSFGFLRSTFTTHIAAYVQDVGYSLAQGAYVLATITGTSIIGRIGMGRVADKIGNRSTFMICYAATALIMIWGLINKDLWGFYLFATVFGISWGAQAVLRFAITSEAFGVVSLGLLTGVFMLAEGGAATIGSYFAAYVFDIIGSYAPAFWTSMALAVMGIILTWTLKSTRR